ncbi:MAG TPA: hypothetical protein VK641_05255 [Terriglobales bacterium]|jgi:hypothetical protein|nr:hypothetical protein [Terriglobales bacterium]
MNFMATPYSWFSFLVQFFGLFQLQMLPAARGIAAAPKLANPAISRNGRYCDKRNAGTKHDRGEKNKKSGIIGGKGQGRP